VINPPTGSRPHQTQELARRRLAMLAGVAVISLISGVMVGARHVSPAQRTGEQFADAWARGDYGAMYRLLDPDSRKHTRPARFSAAYEHARRLATVERYERDGDAHDRDGVVEVPVLVTTRSFGTLRLPLRLLVSDGRVTWAPNLTFPGVPKGAALHRSLRTPARASLLSRDGKVLAEGPADARTSPLGSTATAIAGTLSPAETDSERAYLYERGFSPSAPIGRSGLERAFDERLRGTPGGQLYAGDTLLANSSPRPASKLRTTIDTKLEAAAVQALAGRLGGIAALDPHTGEVRALAGIAFSAPQPPGSTFKIVTATAALEAGLVKLDTPFPVQTKAVIDGVDLENANGESCGGTFAQSFAHSCNSVFAPLGVKIGAKRLVATAERFGFNRDPKIPGAVASTIPKPAEMASPLAVGSSAIGQFRLLATPLQMAQIAQVVAAGGVLHPATLLPVEGHARGRRVMSRRVARQLEKLMIGVVDYGTGTRAQLGGRTKVAGKTGTAELETTVKRDQPGAPELQPTPSETKEPPESKTDAWFAAYAGVRHPKVAVSVMLVRAGAGGDTAAPAAKTVILAAL
jgi:penicillin-binding protein A